MNLFYKITLHLLTCYFLKVNVVFAQCRYTFATSTRHPGATTTDEADALCRARAAASNVPAIVSNAQNFVAFMSNDTHDALWRMGGHAPDCFQTTSGTTVASSTAELFNVQLLGAIWFNTENSGTPNDNNVWTYTTPAGQASVMNCNNGGGLSGSTSHYKGIIGWRAASDVKWAMGGYSSCGLSMAIGCIETKVIPAPAPIGYAYPLLTPCDSVGFVSDYRKFGYELSDSNAMDEACRLEARQSDSAFGDDWQSYRAIYSDGGRIAADMLPQTLCIGSLLGRPFWKRDTTGDSFSLVETPKVAARSGYVNTDGDDKIWIGSSLDLQTRLDTCWTLGSGDAQVVNVRGELEVELCSNQMRLLCVKALKDFQGTPVETLVSGAKIMFVTSDTTTGAIGGLDAADAMCRDAASNSQLQYMVQRSTKFIAYLSSVGMDAAARMLELNPSPINPGPYVNSVGAPLFTDFSEFLVYVEPDSTYFRDEDGYALHDRLQWPSAVNTLTATALGGRYNAAGDCEAWTQTSARYTTYGNSAGWHVQGRTDCGQSRHLVCVEVEETPTQAHYTGSFTLNTPSTCMYMFRSNDRLATDFGNLEALDAICQAYAAMSTKPEVVQNAQHFIGLVSNSTIDFRTRLESRVDFQGIIPVCWKNTLERLVIAEDGDIFGGFDQYLSSMWPDANGEVSNSGSTMSTGTKWDGTASANTCSDWTGTGTSSRTDGFELSHPTATVNCGGLEYFVCVQTAKEAAAPTSPPIGSPTRSPTSPPTRAPSTTPTQAPTLAPSTVPTPGPTVTPGSPSRAPTLRPTLAPSTTPTRVPTLAPAEAAYTTTVTIGDTEQGTEMTTSTAAAAVDTSSTPMNPPMSTLSDTSPAATSDEIVDDESSESDGLLVPLIIGMSVLVVLLICSVLLNIYLRNRRGHRRKAAEMDDLGRTRRADSYYGAHGGRSDLRRSRMKGVGNNSGSSGKASRRSARSRKSVQLSKVAGASAWTHVGAPLDPTLPTVGGVSEYQRMPNLDAAAYTTVPVGFFAPDSSAYGTILSNDSDSGAYQELRVDRPMPVAPAGESVRSGTGTSEPYGHIPSTGGESEYVEMTKI